ncbi:MAG: hypothetical protein JXR59_05560 [Desulfuromonadaceae bacterium]|nr:hypothetical protein [Desulfuromonadaceae bacterium]
MELFNRLIRAIEHAEKENELPDFLGAALRHVAENPLQFSDRQLVARLAEQVSEYDPYCGCGCFGAGCSANDLLATLKELGVEKLSSP